MGPELCLFIVQGSEDPPMGAPQQERYASGSVMLYGLRMLLAGEETRQTVLARYEWSRGAPCYGEGYKTVLDLCVSPNRHLEEHAAQLRRLTRDR